MTHGRAALTMVAVTLMWSIAGMVTRHLDAAGRFEITFWRSAFNAAALAVMLGWLRGPAKLAASVRQGGAALWISSLCWCVMYTAFMVAITLTTVANVLVTMALSPLFTAIGARVVLGQRLAPRTWATIAVAAGGIAWMYGKDLGGATKAQQLLGTAIAMCVPIAAAINLTTIQYTARQHPSSPPDMLPAVLIGAVISALATLPFALPFAASAHDVTLLAFLGIVQLAIPCLLMVTVARVLRAAEVSLLGLLEVIFGVAWAWLAGGETPSDAVLNGGALVLGALAVNEALALRTNAGRDPQPITLAR